MQITDELVLATERAIEEEYKAWQPSSGDAKGTGEERHDNKCKNRSIFVYICVLIFNNKHTTTN